MTPAVTDNLEDMAFVDLHQHLDGLCDRPGRTREAVDLRIALHSHPDLVGYETLTGKIIPCGESVNIHCNRVQLEFWGDEFMALPYVEEKGVRLYSSPPAFFLGRRNLEGFGVIPYQDWEKWIDEAGLDFAIKRYCREELAGKNPTYY